MGTIRTKRNADEYFTLDTAGIAARYNIGIDSARKLGELAGARVKLGNRLLFLVSRTDAYVESLAEKKATAE